jgi:hypothetical protein
MDTAYLDDFVSCVAAEASGAEGAASAVGTEEIAAAGAPRRAARARVLRARLEEVRLQKPTQPRRRGALRVQKRHLLQTGHACDDAVLWIENYRQ